MTRGSLLYLVKRPGMADRLSRSSVVHNGMVDARGFLLQGLIWDAVVGHAICGLPATASEVVAGSVRMGVLAVRFAVC